jgi:succinyl-diaminopimelate desuccinylase
MLLRWVDEDREEILDFLSRFIRTKSPNPPSDTRDAADYACGFLELKSIPCSLTIMSHQD